MNFKELVSKKMTKNCIWAVVLLIVAILSMTIISNIATSPDTYSDTIESIDEKKVAVMGVTAAAAAASTALAAVPGDATGPVAEQIMEISSCLLIVVCILVLEKMLLTAIGYISFNILIPTACLLIGIGIFTNKEKLKTLAIKIIIFALIIVAVVPFCMKISDMMYEVHEASVEQITDIQAEEADEESKKEKNWLQKTLDKFEKTVDDVKEQAKNLLNRFIDAIALFIITYCVLPIAIVLFVIWLSNSLFNLNISVPDISKKLKRSKNKHQNIEADEKLKLSEAERIKIKPRD